MNTSSNTGEGGKRSIGRWVQERELAGGQERRGEHWLAINPRRTLKWEMGDKVNADFLPTDAWHARTQH